MTIDVRESEGRFTFIFRDKLNNIELASIDATHYSRDWLDVTISWDSPAIRLAKGFITWLWSSYDVPFPDWMQGTKPPAEIPKVSEPADPLDAIVAKLATRQIDKTGNVLTRHYNTDERIAIVRLWRKWHDERRPNWTRYKHAQHFHIPDGTLSDWIANYNR